jgi:hypothetical protein
MAQINNLTGAQKSAAKRPVKNQTLLKKHLLEKIMYTTVSGIYENGKIILQESVLTEKSMRVLAVFVEENIQDLPNQSTIKQAPEDAIKQHFSERWQGQFKLNCKMDDARLDYLKQRY